MTSARMPIFPPSITSPEIQAMNDSIEKNKVSNQELLSKCIELKNLIKQSHSCTPSEKETICSAMDDFAAFLNERNQLNPANALDELTIRVLLAQKQNLLFKTRMAQMLLFHQGHQLDSLSDNELVAFCLDSDKIKSYVVLGDNFKEAASVTLTCNEIFKCQINTLLGEVFSTWSRLLELRKKTEASLISLNIPLASLVLNRITGFCNSNLQDLTEWTSDGKIASESYKKLQSDVLLLTSKIEAPKEVAIRLLSRFDQICNLRTKLVKLAAAKKEAVTAQSAPVPIPAAPLAARSRLMPPPAVSSQNYASSSANAPRNVSPPK